jgi:dipeptidyl aminopeptidase/acylaminoacyl peptidase
MVCRLAISVVVSCSWMLGYGQQKTITPEDLVDLRYVVDAQISPDGKSVAFVVGLQNGWSGPRDPHIWIVGTDGRSAPRPFVVSKEGEFSPRWSPDGRFLAFLSHRPNPLKLGDLIGQEKITQVIRQLESEQEKQPREKLKENAPEPFPKMPGTGAEEEDNTQLWMIRMDAGEAVPLTQVDGSVQNFEWSPDGSKIAFTVKDPLTENEKVRRKRKDDAQHVDHALKLARLWVLDFKTGIVRKIGTLDFNVNDLDWSPDGKQLLLRVSKSGRPLDIWYRNKVVIINAESGAITRRVSETAGPMDVRWSPDGLTVAFANLSHSEISELPVLAPAQEGGRELTIGEQYHGTIWAMRWTGPKELIAESLEGTSAKLIAIDSRSGSIRTLANLMAEGPDYSVSADGRKVAFIGQEFSSPSNVWVMEMGGTPRRLTNLHPQVASWNLGSGREITWKNKRDGQAIYGVLITPPEYTEGKRYPLIVDVHGGPEWAWWSGWAGSWHEWGQLLASHGYAVLMPNPRGSDGQGPKFAEAVHADWGGMDFEDILSGVDDLVDKGIADPDRLGIGGWSYGGFMSSWAIGHTTRFKAAVIGAAVTDLISFYGSTDITPNFPAVYFDGPPQANRKLYEAHSPLSFAQNAKTPSLILHGEADPRVPATQGWELYNALQDAGVKTELVTYPREPHGIREPEHEKDVLTRVLAWYDKHLKP